MRKFGNVSQYPPRSLNSAEAALLTAWRSMDRYWNDLVLVGGLAVHYLTRREVPGLPGAVTMDVDFGISLGIEGGGMYGTIQTHLSGLGFSQEGSRWVQEHGDFNLYIDFLTEDPPHTTGVRMVDGAQASLMPGINRALAKRRRIRVRGKDLFGVNHECDVNVADIGPLLVLKINAFGGPTGRRHPKDAYDVLLAVSGFLEGPEAAIAAFRAEENAGNTAFAGAIECLTNDFSEPDRDGPARGAGFHPGDDGEQERVRQDLVTVGRALLGI